MEGLLDHHVLTRWRSLVFGLTTLDEAGDFLKASRLHPLAIESGIDRSHGQGLLAAVLTKVNSFVKFTRIFEGVDRNYG